MNYRTLGRSDLKVSEIALGSWLTFGVGVERDRATACLRKALDLGINFIDTANIYGKGAAETFLGEALKDVPRKSYIIGTKLFWPMTPTDRGLSAAQIRKQIDASLQRLRIECVDLYQCHRYDQEVPLEETLGAMGAVVRQGKARYIGFSEWTAPQIAAALKLPGVERFVSSQPQYSMLWRKPERDVIPLCEREQIGQIVWSPLAQGVLTGKYKPGQPPPKDSRAANPAMNVHMNDQGVPLQNEKLYAAVQELEPVAKARGLSLAEMALAWVLRQKNVASAIVGASRPEQLESNVRASGVKLDADALGAIDRILKGFAQFD
ncbi:MAG: aldo/keto reductase family protein [Planctomycetes bacterium]|nr:aldo/keto reductase family protein [Planctomycetota bacterium]